MTTYRVSDSGYDIALVSLADVSPQPRSEGVKATRRTFAASGAVYDQGLCIELEFSVLDSEAVYQALLGQFGLDAAAYASVTIYVPNEQFIWSRYNGIAVRPLLGSDARRTNYFVRDVTILVKHLEIVS